MEVSQGQIHSSLERNFNMTKEKFTTKNEADCIKKICEICSKTKSTEICGFVGKKDDVFVVEECKNVAEDKTNYFAIDPIDYLMFKNDYDLIFVFHSHIIGDEEPSEFDIIMSENSCVPFFIHCTVNKKNNIYLPKNHETDVLTIDRFKECL